MKSNYIEEMFIYLLDPLKIVHGKNERNRIIKKGLK